MKYKKACIFFNYVWKTELTFAQTYATCSAHGRSTERTSSYCVTRNILMNAAQRRCKQSSNFQWTFLITEHIKNTQKNSNILEYKLLRTYNSFLYNSLVFIIFVSSNTIAHKGSTSITHNPLRPYSGVCEANTNILSITYTHLFYVSNFFKNNSNLFIKIFFSYFK